MAVRPPIVTSHSQVGTVMEVLRGDVGAAWSGPEVSPIGDCRPMTPGRLLAAAVVTMSPWRDTPLR